MRFKAVFCPGIQICTKQKNMPSCPFCAVWRACFDARQNLNLASGLRPDILTWGIFPLDPLFFVSPFSFLFLFHPLEFCQSLITRTYLNSAGYYGCSAEKCPPGTGVSADRKKGGYSYARPVAQEAVPLSAQ